jgi:hypothetical protein
MAIAREVATVTRLGIEVNHQHLCIVFLGIYLFLIHFSLNLLQLMVVIDIIFIFNVCKINFSDLTVAFLRHV